MRNTRDLSQEELIDLWLVPVHGVRFEEAVQTKEQGDTFYDDYPVTKGQHDEWDEVASAFVRRKLRITKDYATRIKWSWYLNTAPKIK